MVWYRRRHRQRGYKAGAQESKVLEDAGAFVGDGKGRWAEGVGLCEDLEIRPCKVTGVACVVFLGYVLLRQRG